MRTGLPVISHRIGLIEGTRTVPGCLLFLPVYAPGTTPGDPAARERALQGWVFASLRVDLLLRGVAAFTDGQVDFEAFEETKATAQSLLFDSDETMAFDDAHWTTASTAALSASLPVPVFGRS